MKEYLYVLDYSDSTICKIDLCEFKQFEDGKRDIEDILKIKGINPNTASWMVTNIEIDNIIEL